MLKSKSQESTASTLFKDHQILTKRPDDMDFYVYKFLRYTQDLVLKKMFRRCPKRELIGIIPGNPIYHTKRIRHAITNPIPTEGA
jgi:hypothetical protein